MKLCIILHCILLSGYSPAAPFNIQLQRKLQCVRFFCVFRTSLFSFFWWSFLSPWCLSYEMLVHHDAEKTRLRLRIMETFIQEELFHCNRQPCGARALGVVACPDAYHDLHPLPHSPSCAFHGSKLNL